MVLRSMPPPAWLASDAPQGDVVLSSRCRVLRNVAGYRFPHAAERSELEEVLKKTLAAVKSEHLELEAHRNVSDAEKEHLIACRLSSHHFDMNAPGRALLLDGPRSVSLMVNEEDHLRLQALTAGWSIGSAAAQAEAVLDRLEGALSFAKSPRFGVLAASPFNTGVGRRLSSMFHLIGLAQAKRLPKG
jgi:protein arginine kinase